MFKRKRSVNKKRLEHKLYLARETPELTFDLSDCDILNIPSGIYSLCKVFLKECLMLQNNQLNSLAGGGDLRDLVNLKVLDISNNDFHSLTDDICLLTNLQELYLDNNQLKILPKSICHIVNLKTLSLTNNKLKSLPEDLGFLVNLQQLKLKGNQPLKHLPKSICKARNLALIEVDKEHFLYPPQEIIEQGTEAMIKYISNDIGFEYIPSDDIVKNIDILDTVEEIDNIQDKLWDLEQKKLRKMREFLEIEKNNEIAQLQELEMANKHKVNREKLLASISRQQSKLDLKLSQIQQVREAEKFQLIETLHDMENNADIAIQHLLSLNRGPTVQLLEKEQEEEQKLLAAVNKYNDAVLKKDDILAAMQDILNQETELFNKFSKNRDETSRSILEQELQTDTKLALLLESQDTHKATLFSQLREDSNLQKAAVASLLERGDARSWGLLQQVRLVENQLFALTNIELDRKKLKMDKHLNDLSEKRLNLSMLLIQLLEQQQERRTQLLSTLRTIEEYNSDDAEDFWLRQYQQLLEKFPQGLSKAQRNIDPKLAEILLANGVLQCLPFLAKLTQCQSNPKNISELNLIEAGINVPSDRKKILDALHTYSKEEMFEDTRPSAPPCEFEASAPPIECLNTINSIECVVCLDLECQIIFIPCGHLCCCSACSAAVQECPLCRAHIVRKITMVQQ